VARRTGDPYPDLNSDTDFYPELDLDVDSDPVAHCRESTVHLAPSPCPDNSRASWKYS